jgi:hypothetical protein
MLRITGISYVDAVLWRSWIRLRDRMDADVQRRTRSRDCRYVGRSRRKQLRCSAICPSASRCRPFGPDQAFKSGVNRAAAAPGADFWPHSAIPTKPRRAAPSGNRPERQLGVRGGREMRPEGPAHRSISFVSRDPSSYRVHGRPPPSACQAGCGSGGLRRRSAGANGGPHLRKRPLFGRRCLPATIPPRTIRKLPRAIWRTSW